MYLHKVENKGKNMKASKAKSERDEDSKKEKIAQSKNTLDEERDNHLTGDEQNKGNESKLEDIVVDLEEEMSPENDIILDLRTKHDTLERDNKLLKEELEKLKRVLINMNNVLKTKYS